MVHGRAQLEHNSHKVKVSVEATCLTLQALHALIQTNFHIGDCFWAYKNQRQETLKQSFYLFY